MSIAAFAQSEASLAMPSSKRVSGKPPPKRTIIALSDTKIISEAR